MNRKGNNRGFSMGEMLVTVAILAVLAALVFAGVAQYRKSMRQREMDAIAKQIFITAQNHLSTAESQSFLNLAAVSPTSEHDDSFGYKEKDDKGKFTGVYFFVFGDGSPDTPVNDSSLLNYMLPPGSIDDAARLGGSYIIRYQKAPAVILDVFYSSEVSFGAGYTDYDKLFNISKTPNQDYTGDANRERRQDYDGTGKIVGWYGGEDSKSGEELKAPTIRIRNEEILEVIITDTNPATVKHQLIIKGLTSGKTAVLEYDPAKGKVTLDNICVTSEHFANHTQFKELFPGENISVQAKVFSNDVLTNVATSELKVTNSLFDDATSVKYDAAAEIKNRANAVISNIRHLENLSEAVSGCGTANLSVETAVQTKDLLWSDFRNAESIRAYKDWAITALSGTATNEPGVFHPVVTANAITYDGGYHSIGSGEANAFPIREPSGNVGLFGTLTDSTVKNLELINFSVTGGTSSKAGTLAGESSASRIINVLSIHDADKTLSVSGGSAGGLIGEAVGGNITACAAAVKVDGTTAGGLIGTSSAAVTGCYSAGHVKDKADNNGVEYIQSPYDVQGVDAGGLIGKNSGAVSYSYSTCSAYGKGSGFVGGFVGQLLSGSSVHHCYSTGLVRQSSGEIKADGTVVNNAFVGNSEVGSQSGHGNYYYMIVNEVAKYKEGSTTDIEKFLYKAAGGPPDHDNDASAFDDNATRFNDFVSKDSNGNLWDYTKPAKPYNATLKKYYNGSYSLPTVPQLGATLTGGSIPLNYFVYTHYGDWPAPEIFVINNG